MIWCAFERRAAFRRSRRRASDADLGRGRIRSAMKKSVPSRPALERPGCQDRTFSAVHQTGVHDEQTDDAAKKARLPFRVKLRNTQHEQMSSGLPLKADIAQSSQHVSKVPKCDSGRFTENDLGPIRPEGNLDRPEFCLPAQPMRGFVVSSGKICSNSRRISDQLRLRRRPGRKN